MNLDRSDYLLIVLWGCVAFVLGYALCCAYQKKRLPLLNVRCAAWLVFSIYLASLCYLTGMLDFIRNPAAVHSANIFTGFDLIPFRGHVYKPIVQNYLLFLPLGFLVPSVTPKCRWSLPKMMLLGLGVSLFIELLQGFIGRLQEVDDLLMNTAGTAAGFLVWAALFRRERRLWQRVLIIAVTALLTLAMLSGIAQLCAMR